MSDSQPTTTTPALLCGYYLCNKIARKKYWCGNCWEYFCTSHYVQVKDYYHYEQPIGDNLPTDMYA